MILLLQTLSCAVLTGLIWTIQIVHYPSFHFVSDDRFPKFHAFHSRAITFIVLPLMLFELATAIALASVVRDSVFVWINLVGVVCIWGSTFFISVPLHNQLTSHRDSKYIDRLIQTNWLRTILWTARMFLLGWMLVQVR